MNESEIRADERRKLCAWVNGLVVSSGRCVDAAARPRSPPAWSRSHSEDRKSRVCRAQYLCRDHGGTQMAEPRKVEMKLDGQWLDLSGYVSNMDLSHGGDQKDGWRELLAGLEPVTITLDNSTGAFFPEPRQRYRVSREVPDGRWQAFKWRLKQRWPFGWLKVRYRWFSLDAEFESWDGSNLTMRGDGPIVQDTVERR